MNHFLSDSRFISGKSPLKHLISRVYANSSFHQACIKTEVLALGRPLIEHRDAMAVQWLVEKCRTSGEIPVAFCITVSRVGVRVRVSPGFLPFPSNPTFPRHPVFVYSSCFQSLSAEIWFVAPRSWFWTTIMAPSRGLHQGPSSLRVKRRASVRRYTRMCYARVYFAPRFLARRSRKEESFLFLSHSLTESNCFNLSLCAR